MKLYTDLDGTLITTKSGNTFAQDEDDWKFIPNILSSLVNFTRKNNISTMTIVTNQAGIDEGYHRPLEITNKLDNIVNNIKRYFQLESLKIHIHVSIATSLKSTERKPFVYGIWKNPDLHTMPGKYEEVQDYFHILQDGKMLRYVTNKKVGYMIGDASGINYLRKAEVDDSLRSLARKTWKSGEINFNYKNKSYTISQVNQGDADIMLYPEPKTIEDQPKPIYLGVFRVRKDFSDSDKVHAEINNLEYIDYEDFINEWK